MCFGSDRGGLSDNAVGQACATDAQGNVLVTGSFTSTNFTLGGTVLTNLGSANVFVAKFSPAGDLLWTRQAGGSLTEACYSIAVDAIGNGYVYGVLRSTNAVFGNVTLVASPTGYPDSFMAKYSAVGDLVWVKQIKGAPGGHGGVAVEPNGTSHVTGFFPNQADFGGLVLTNSSGTFQDHVYCVKYDAAGNPLWARETGTGGETLTSAIGIDPSGNSYVTGILQDGTSVFGSNTISGNIFVVKLDSLGNVLWAKGGATGTIFDANATSLAVDVTGNCTVAGYVGSTNVSFGGIVLSNPQGGGAEDMGFMVKYDRDGNLLWARNVFGSKSSFMGFKSIAEDQWQNVFAIGGLQNFFQVGGFNFDGSILGQPTFGGVHIFVAKLDGPQVSLAPVGGQMMVAWPTNAAGLGLERASDLTLGDWAVVTNAPVVVGQQNTFTEDVAGGSRFYRLHNN
ncbi:MAG: hypothetical protein JWR19_2829 [Pedosphaera sp.]|nr:hypothetical protein [Pedosphaera sp.]